MELHTPQNLNPLSLEKKGDRGLIEEDPFVKNLIDSKLLLKKALYLLLTDFLGLTKNINNLLEKRDASIQRTVMSSDGSHHYPFYFFRNNIHGRRIGLEIVKKLRTATKKQKKELERELEKLAQEERKKQNRALNRKIRTASNQLQLKLDTFEKKHKLKLNILDPLNLYLCRNCKKILSLGRFGSKTCDCCNRKTTTPSGADSIVIYRFGENIVKFIEANMWLEHGLDYLLRRKHFNTKCGIYILGHSGVGHEIDNLAEISSEKLRIICECKNSDINVSDIFIFSGKMEDIGCTREYIFTTSFNTNRDVRPLARSKNITIIEQVLEKDDEKLIKEIQEGY